MSGSPRYKVYTAQREHVASCKHLEDCAAIVALYGNGAQVRVGHSMVIWTEGREEIPASESFDRAAEIMLWHERDAQAKAHAKAQSHVTAR